MNLVFLSTTGVIETFPPVLSFNLTMTNWKILKCDPILGSHLPSQRAVILSKVNCVKNIIDRTQLHFTIVAPLHTFLSVSGCYRCNIHWCKTCPHMMPGTKLDLSMRHGLRWYPELSICKLLLTSLLPNLWCFSLARWALWKKHSRQPASSGSFTKKGKMALIASRSWRLPRLQHLLTPLLTWEMA